MNPSDPAKPDFEHQPLRVRPKIVTTYLILSLLVTALATFLWFMLTTPASGMNWEPIETMAFFFIAFVNLGCLVSTIGLFFWRKWAGLAFYILLGLSLIWFGTLFLIQEGINATTISGFFTLGIFPILLFRWVVNKIWLKLI